MEYIQHNCKNCGGVLNPQSDGRWKCRNCGTVFDVETAEKHTRQMQEMFDDQKREMICNLRRNLYNALRAPYISSTEIYDICSSIKQYLPDDFQANFYSIASGSNVHQLTRAIHEIDAEKHFDEIEGVIQYLIRSLQSEFLLELNLLVERTYGAVDRSKYEQYATEISKEAERVQAGVYETKLPREVFVAYSSKDMDKVSELVQTLESQGMKCFVAARNLRHGRGAVENYKRAIEEAMDHCRTFVFVSSRNSRSLDCDALKIEIPYVEKRDLENAPAEYRNNYTGIPQAYKKPRVEYRVEESILPTAADTVVGEFFDGYEYAYSSREVANRVMKQLLQMNSSTEDNGPKTKICGSCGAETPADAHFCSACGGSTFVASLAEFIRLTNEQQEVTRREAEKKIEEARKEAEAAKKAQIRAERRRKVKYGAADYEGESDPRSSHNPWVIGFLCFFFGFLGIHRFIVGKKGTGILYLCTGGLLGVGVLFDLIAIIGGRFTDERGFRIGTRRRTGCLTAAVIVFLAFFVFLLVLGLALGQAFGSDTYPVEEPQPDETADPITGENPGIGLDNFDTVFNPGSFTPNEIGLEMVDMLAMATEFNGNYYLYLDLSMSWDQAKLYCEALGGHLAVITSVAENDLCYQLYTSASDYDRCFLGATDDRIEGIWEWVNGEEWSLNHWSSGAPNGGISANQAGFSAYDDGWVDIDGYDFYPFICEWEAEEVVNLKGVYGYLSSSGMIFNNAVYYNGNIYKAFQYDMSVEEALEYCETLGGHLATLTTARENQAISAYLFSMGVYDCLLGATDETTDGIWRWCTGETFSYSSWYAGEPNGGSYDNFLVHRGDITGEWSDTGYFSGFLCEWENCNISFTEDSKAGGSDISPIPNAEELYEEAVTRMQNGAYLTAYSTFSMLDNYKQSATYAEFCMSHSGLRYQMDGTSEGYTITGYTGTESVLLLPESYEGIPFIHIADRAFEGQIGITEVLIGSKICTVGEYAFSECTALEAAVFPGQDVVRIGEGAFANCSALLAVVLPEGIDCIASWTFSNCYSLQTVTVPRSVSAIDSLAFENCDRLTDVYYMGTESDWEAIQIESNNERLLSATRHDTPTDHYTPVLPDGRVDYIE